jgi:hypothetical protein
MDQFILLLYYAAGTWLNKGLQEKYLRRVFFNSTLQILFGKRRQECSTLELRSLANMLTPSRMALYHPCVFLAKNSGCKRSEICTPLQRTKYFTKKEKKYHGYQLDF